MVSITFFIFVALVIVVGFFAATWRRKNRVPLDPDGTVEGNSRLREPDRPFTEPRGDIKGGILPADNPLSENRLDEQDEPTK